MTGLVTLRDLCIDANDPQRVGEFWAALLGREPADAGSGDGLTPDVVLRASPDSPGPTIWVNGVPEPKAGKTRIHLDVDLREGRGIEDLLALGAVVLGSPEGARWWVLADPEGNEFCAFLPEGIASNDAEAEVPVVDVELPE